MKKRVLQVLGGIGFGGAEAFVMNQYYNLKREYTFDFAIQVRFDENHSYEREIKELGGEIYYTGLFRTSPFMYAENIKKIIEEHGPYTAVHIHVNEQCGFAALGAKKAGIEHIIVHAHSSQYGQKNKVVKMLMLTSNKALVKKNAKTIVACSDEAIETYFGKEAKKTARVLKNPIDIQRFFYVDEEQSLREELGISESKLVISHIGRFIDVKNHSFTIELCRELKNAEIDYIMLLVGDGGLRPEIVKKVEEYKLADKVFFLGERKDIPRVLKASDAMILPSKYEGLPTVVLEAQASGTPCIVSSNVSHMSDVGLGLVRFIDINNSESMEHWINAVKSLPKKEKDFLRILNAFEEKGISLNSVSQFLRSVYG